MEKLSDTVIAFINSLGIYGPILSCLLIFFESILPFLPLAVFITINFLTFGNLLGFIISWIFTILGCLMSYYIFKKGIRFKFKKIIKNKETIEKFMNNFKNISLKNLVILVSIPFTPAFLVNIAAGLSNMKFKKFFISLIIGKIVIVYFWGYIGTSLIESFKEPIILLRIFVLVTASYLISSLISKKLNL